MWMWIYSIGYLIFYVLLMVEISDREGLDGVGDVVMAMLVSLIWPAWVTFALVSLFLSPFRRS